VEVQKIVVFQAGNEEYGIPIEHVMSIEKMMETTAIPQMPSYLKGIVKVRGELIPVVDIGLVFYNQAVVNSDKSRIVVVHNNELFAGFLVDEAKEIIDIPKESMKDLNLMAFGNTPYFIGVASLENRLITLVDPQKLLDSLEGMTEIQQQMLSHH
jgi:purine-binding chemotaxis protein CheW